MPNYSVAQARNGLPRLIDKAIAGEEVVITRHGKVVAEVRAKGEPAESEPYDYEALWQRVDARGRVSIDSVSLIDAMYDEPKI